MKKITDIITVSAVSSAIIFGWIHQVIATLIASTNGDFDHRFLWPSYFVALFAIVVFLITCFMKYGEKDIDKKKLNKTILATIFFLVALGTLFLDINKGDGLGGAVKSLYAILATRAGCLVIGFWLFSSLLKRKSFPDKKIWCLVSKIVMIILALTALLMFIPVFGDFMFAFAFIIAAPIQLVCMYGLMTK